LIAEARSLRTTSRERKIVAKIAANFPVAFD
jgi:hypothetical protein